MKRLQGIFISLIILGSINGCATDSQHEKSTEFPFDLMVNIIDLSNQFKYWGGEFPIVDGAISLKVSYRNKSEKTGAFFTHQISIYTDTESAQLAFPSWENDWFNEHWIHPLNSVYSPKDLKDTYRLECMDLEINSLPTKSCTLLQLHNNLVILVLANINTDNISFSEFEEILTKLDTRLPTDEIYLPITQK